MEALSKKYKLKGSSLIESMVAMVIIGIVFSVAMMTLESVLTNQNEAMMFRVNMALNYEFEVAKNAQVFLGETVDKKDFVIKKEWSVYQDSKELMLLKLLAIKADKILEERDYILFLSKKD